MKPTDIMFIRVGGQKFLVHNCNENFISRWNARRKEAERIRVERAEKIQRSKNQLIDTLTARGDYDEQSIRNALEKYNTLGFTGKTVTSGDR